MPNTKTIVPLNPPPPSSVHRCNISLSTLRNRAELSQPPLFFSDCDLCRGLDTLSSHSVSGDSHEAIALNIQPDFRYFFQGALISSLMPAGPDAQHMLDSSSMSVVIVSLSWCSIRFQTQGVALLHG